MNYLDAKNLLNGRSHKVLESNTILSHDGENFSIFFYGKKLLTFRKNGKTKIEKFDNRTVTTKKRINNYIERRKIIQKDSVWFWNDGKKFVGGEVF